MIHTKRGALAILVFILASCATGDTARQKLSAPKVAYTPPSVGKANYGPIPRRFEMPARADNTGGKSEADYPDEKIIQLAKQLPKASLSSRISLNLKGADINTAISQLGALTGFNFMVTPQARAIRSADIALENVPWLKALKVITRSNDLVASVNGVDIFSGEDALRSISANGVIVISDYKSFRKEQSRRKEEATSLVEIAGQKRLLAREKADTIKAEDLNALVTKSYQFEYADPADALAYLETLYSEKTISGAKVTKAPSRKTKTARRTMGRLPPGLSFALYRPENMITITAPARLMSQIMGLLEQIDVKPRQVYIEARITEIQRNFIKDLGVQWGGYAFTVTNRNFPATVGVTGAGAGAGPGAGAPGVVSLPPKGAVDPSTGAILPNAAGGAVGITLGGISGTTLLRARLMALEQEGLSRTLSNPKIMVINGGSATIKSGKEIPYQSSSANYGTVVRFREAVISLTVKALIMRDNRIRLKIRAKKNEVDPTLSVQGTPAIKKKELNTSVVVKNGGSAALGGMFEEENSNFQDRVPWFHKAPLLGWLFKNDRKVDNRLELIVFITPTIVSDEMIK